MVLHGITWYYMVLWQVYIKTTTYGNGYIIIQYLHIKLLNNNE